MQVSTIIICPKVGKPIKHEINTEGMLFWNNVDKIEIKEVIYLGPEQFKDWKDADTTS